jgi:hypothetical protein
VCGRKARAFLTDCCFTLINALLHRVRWTSTSSREDTGAAAEVARVAVRRHQFAVGRPLEFDEATPRIAAIEAVVTADLEHALAFFEVLGEPGRPFVRHVHIKVFASCADQRAARERFDTVRDFLGLTVPVALSVGAEKTSERLPPGWTSSRSTASAAMVYLMHLCGVACYLAAVMSFDE